MMEKQLAVHEFGANIAAAGQNFILYESFLGLVGDRKGTEIGDFLKMVPALVSASMSGPYDPGLIVDRVLDQLSGNTLDGLGCGYCGAEFVMLKRKQKGMQGKQLTGNPSMYCPDCGGSSKIVVKKRLGSTLNKVIITGIPTLKKPGTTSPDDVQTSPDKPAP